MMVHDQLSYENSCLLAVSLRGLKGSRCCFVCSLLIVVTSPLFFFSVSPHLYGFRPLLSFFLLPSSSSAALQQQLVDSKALHAEQLSSAEQLRNEAAAAAVDLETQLRVAHGKSETSRDELTSHQKEFDLLKVKATVCDVY